MMDTSSAKRISSLLPFLESPETAGVHDCTVRAVTLDSRQAGPGTLFIAQKGGTSDGHDHIDDAVRRGAAAILCERIPAAIAGGVAYIAVPDTHQAAAAAAAWFNDFPARDLAVIGITGTNGKTTVATLMYQALNLLGEKTGLISTVVCRIGDQAIESTHTTPDAIALHNLFRRMKDAGCTHVAMEASSHAIAQERIRGIPFRAGIFTNLTQDHLDFHKTMDEYGRTKKRFFDELPETAVAVTNADDPKGAFMISDSPAQRISYGTNTEAEYAGTVTEKSPSGMTIRTNDGELHTSLVGGFNISNALAVYATLRSLGYPHERIAAAFPKLAPPSGRIETIPGPEGRTGIVDYAHTPDGLEKVLDAVRGMRQGGGRIIVVFGCGGDRDRTKRPIMGRIGAELADYAIITSDNPRTEDPKAICAETAAGVPAGLGEKIAIETDRRQAIRRAVSLSRPGDWIVLAGKGHESYQVIGTEKMHFSDQEELREAFKDAAR